MTYRPRICFAGPLLGSQRNRTPAPAEELGHFLRDRGYEIHLTSRVVNRYARFVDIALTIIRIRNKIDIISVQTFSGPSFVVADLISRLALRLGKKLMMVLHGGALPEFTQAHPRWTRRVLRRAHFLVVPSPYLAHLVSEMGLEARIIPNGINLQDYPFRLRQQACPSLLWMRTFHEIYNPIMAVDVLEGLLKGFPEAHLTMAGQDKGLLESTKARVKSARLEDHVTFAGFLDLSAKQQQFARHDIYLHTNQVDNMPVSVIEAAAFGLPIIATEVGGIPYLLKNGKTGLLVGDGNSEGMLRAVVRILQEPGLSENLSLNGHQLSEGYDWQNIIFEWEKVFQEVLSIQ